MFARRWTATRLESGILIPIPIGRPLAAAYAAFAARSVARPVQLPPLTEVIGVGGCTLGGAGKTIVAIAWARALAERGASVAFVGHGFRATINRPRRVHPTDSVAEVGDDALLAARSLHAAGVTVWVAPTRKAALHQAARHARVLVVDGLLQTRPARLSRSILVVDARRPFGSGACPPLGDLKAPTRAFRNIADHVVLVADPSTSSIRATCRLLASHGIAPSHVAIVNLSACLDQIGTPRPLHQVRGLRLGLALTLARPDRVIASLRARNVLPLCLWKGLDHHPPSGRDLTRLRDLVRRHRLDAWLTTSKCATLFEGKPLGAPLWTLALSTHLDPQPVPVLDSPHANDKNPPLRDCRTVDRLPDDDRRLRWF